jgi:hypothetical protein
MLYVDVVCNFVIEALNGSADGDSGMKRQDIRRCCPHLGLYVNEGALLMEVQIEGLGIQGRNRRRNSLNSSFQFRVLAGICACQRRWAELRLRLLSN